MNHSFLIHVSRKIPRSQLNRAIASQLASISGTNPKCFSSSTATRSPVTLWGADSIARSLRTRRSVVVALQPIRSVNALKRHVSTMQLRESDPSNGSSAGSLPDGNGAAAGGENGNGEGDGDDKSSRRPYTVIDNQLQKPTVPEVYPQLLAVPIARRPLFPGFYKAVVVKDPNVTSAIKELLKRGQPYVGAFLLKDENVDVDTITSLDQVHKVGVFAQITSVFPASSGSKDGSKEEDGGLTAVLYPHRRIEITELVNTHGNKEAPIEEVRVKSETEEAAENEQQQQLPKELSDETQELGNSFFSGS